ncbi:MAG: phosphomannomutase/phosphoglucomutase [Candidatus Ryanbacteria bacterium CG10_big_fil_rev_8_21_14_0_10_43_42]|uniref:Phosphomannomutase/phosphoglucomutase n=1 Tax=Candidatus Ryanbacteria bacterium CG10_big_fil_rev_8_21_14_0_10_43_42 TaxID=1974864 RepID=A0A2M8KWU9_9BACT|nr:MAG: phosphomannomutase/phosphoglucomutase [Candidatus Ryanbacteria bacterium CG10_big_fil_rev_8_21_14_0_10_43_42]
MQINSSIFRAYDIRGRYPEELNEQTAYRIGRSFASFLKSGSVGKDHIRVLVNGDARPSSPSLTKEIINGLTDEGCDVLDAGLSTTPMHYFAVNHFDVDGGIMVTASHNPSEYNGCKLSRRELVSVGGGTGMEEIRNMVVRGVFPLPQKKGRVQIISNLKKDYIAFVRSKFSPKDWRPQKIVFDTGNGMVGLILRDMLAGTGITYSILYEDIDMTYPNHTANPLDEHTLDDLKRAVKEEHADMGVAFDGDGDRIAFITAEGDRVRGEYMTALFGLHALSREAGVATVYDLRSSKAVSEVITEAGGMSVRSRVGHTFIKRAMHKYKAVVGGEVSGHYYFQETFFAESSMYALFLLVQILSEKNQSLSGVVRPLDRYATTGELNFSVTNADSIIDDLAVLYKNEKTDYLDGLTVEADNFWFNMRVSNTEGVLRLNLEAKDKKILQQVLKDIKSVLKVG